MEKHYLSEYHRQHSLAAKKEVEEMLKHPCSYEEALQQVERIKSASTKNCGSNG